MEWVSCRCYNWRQWAISWLLIRSVHGGRSSCGRCPLSSLHQHQWPSCSDPDTPALSQGSLPLLSLSPPASSFTTANSFPPCHSPQLLHCTTIWPLHGSSLINRRIDFLWQVEARLSTLTNVVSRGSVTVQDGEATLGAVIAGTRDGLVPLNRYKKFLPLEQQQQKFIQLIDKTENTPFFTPFWFGNLLVLYVSCQVSWRGFLLTITTRTSLFKGEARYVLDVKDIRTTWRYWVNWRPSSDALLQQEHYSWDDQLMWVLRVWGPRNTEYREGLENKFLVVLVRVTRNGNDKFEECHEPDASVQPAGECGFWQI